MQKRSFPLFLALFQTLPCAHGKLFSGPSGRKCWTQITRKRSRTWEFAISEVACRGRAFAPFCSLVPCIACPAGASAVRFCSARGALPWYAYHVPMTGCCLLATKNHIAQTWLLNKQTPGKIWKISVHVNIEQMVKKSTFIMACNYRTKARKFSFEKGS